MVCPTSWVNETPTCPACWPTVQPSDLNLSSFASFEHGYVESDATLRLILVPTPGDGNGDGKVDGLDYVIWAMNFDDDPADNPPGSPVNGDFNDDGVVNGLDYVTWAINFGQGPNDTAAVPEPGTFGLFVVALKLLWSRWRQR